MNDMNVDRRRLSQQLRQDLSELKFSAAMREAVLARVRAEGQAEMLPGPETRRRPDLRAVPPRTRSERPRQRPWRRTGLWLTGGTVAAAALIIGVVMSGPFSGTGLPEQRLAEAPGMADGEVFALTSLGGGGDAETAAGDASAVTVTAAPPDRQMPSEAAARGEEGSPPDVTATEATEVTDGESSADSEPTAGLPDATEEPRRGAGVAAQPGTNGHGPKDHGRATLQDLNKEAELIVLAQVRAWEGSDLTLAPVEALRGDLPPGDLTVTMPAGESTLHANEFVLVFLRHAEAGAPQQAAHQLDSEARLTWRWRLVGGMAGIFRLSADGALAESAGGVIDLDAIRDEVQ